MWTILKFDKKKILFLKKDFEEKLGKDFIFYEPKFMIKSFKKNKLIQKELSLLGDYIFCFNEKFKEQKMMDLLRSSRGLKYFLNGSFSSQIEINKFISLCKERENKNGFITENIFEMFEKKKYKFLDGPFANQIFEIINFRKKKIEIMIGNIRTKIDKEKFILNPI